MYHFQTNSQGLCLLIHHPHAELINSFLQTDGDSFSDIIEAFLTDEQQQKFSGNIFKLKKQQYQLVLQDKISQQYITMTLTNFTELFQQWLSNN